MKKLTVENLTLMSLATNLSFAVYNCVVGLSSKSWWYITLGIYYVILSVMRHALLQIKRKASSDESYQRFVKRFTGFMLMALSVSLVGTVILSVVTDRGTKHHEIVMITIALYAFTKVTLAIINLVKARKNDSAIIKALRNVSFADALVSIFSLQRSMLVSFGGMDPDTIKLFNILTGAGVCILVFLLGLNLVGGRRISMAKSKIVKANENIAKAVVGGYKKVENAVVGGYTKIEDKFVDMYLTREGETVEQAKQRLKNQNK